MYIYRRLMALGVSVLVGGVRLGRIRETGKLLQEDTPARGPGTPSLTARDAAVLPEIAPELNLARASRDERSFFRRILVATEVW